MTRTRRLEEEWGVPVGGITKSELYTWDRMDPVA